MARRHSKRNRRQQRRSRRYGGADEAPVPANAQAPAVAQAPVKEEKSFIDNIFGSKGAEKTDVPAPANDAPEAKEAPAPAPAPAPEAPASEEKPGALASLFGTDEKDAAPAPAQEPSVQPMKKKRSRRCKCYTPKKLKAACKKMRSRRRRSSQKRSFMRMSTPAFEKAPNANTFANMYGAPHQAQMGF